MKKYILAAIIVAVVATSLAVSSYSLTGFFSKAFDKSLSPGEHYEKNITVRKYYNLTIRFQKQNSSSYLGFDNNESVVILKDADGNEIARAEEAVNGRVYFFTERLELDRIKTVSAYTLGDYQDIENQEINITYSGTKAYITLKVSYGPASITGYVLDDLTGQIIEGVEVLAFPDGSDPALTEPIQQNTSTGEGRYLLSFQLNSSKALDIYVKDYIAD